jgi:hypothetical protein
VVLGSGRAGNGSGRTGTEQRKRRGGAAFSSFLRRARRWSLGAAGPPSPAVIGRAGGDGEDPEETSQRRALPCLQTTVWRGWSLQLLLGSPPLTQVDGRGGGGRAGTVRGKRGCATHLLIISPRFPATSGARSPVSAERGRRGASRRGRLCVASVRARAIRPRRPKIAARGSERGSVVWV